jgi:hypothetical protein
MDGEPKLPLILIRYECPRCHFVSAIEHYCEKRHVPMRKIAEERKACLPALAHRTERRCARSRHDRSGNRGNADAMAEGDFGEG